MGESSSPGQYTGAKIEVNHKELKVGRYFRQPPPHRSRPGYYVVGCSVRGCDDNVCQTRSTYFEEHTVEFIMQRAKGQTQMNRRQKKALYNAMQKTSQKCPAKGVNKRKQPASDGRVPSPSPSGNAPGILSLASHDQNDSMTGFGGDLGAHSLGLHRISGLTDAMASDVEHVSDSAPRRLPALPSVASDLLGVPEAASAASAAVDNATAGSSCGGEGSSTFAAAEWDEVAKPRKLPRWSSLAPSELSGVSMTGVFNGEDDLAAAASAAARSPLRI